MRKKGYSLIFPFLLLFALSCVPQSEEGNEEIGSSKDNTLVSDSFLDNCAELKEGPRRGLTCLQCLHPKAQPQALALANVLVQSCLKNVAMNYLADGSFGFNESILFSHIDIMTGANRDFLMLFLLGNGSAQRMWARTSIEAFGTKISPESFRYAIKVDPVLRGEFVSLLDRLLPVLHYAEGKGVRIALAPMLEDNLDLDSFQSMIGLVEQELLPTNLNLQLARNPCHLCNERGMSKIPYGIMPVFHLLWPEQVTFSGGIISNDGEDYEGNYISFYTCEHSDRKYSLNELLKLQDGAGKANNTFLIWTARYQGLGPELPCGSAPPHPDLRFYPVPSEGDSILLKSILTWQID